MEYPSYLIHFNPNHDPKTGRFDFSKGFDSKVKYGGKKRSEYVKDMKGQYKSAGYGSIKSSRYAKTAADQNQWETYQYNKGIKKFKKTAEKMHDVLDKNGNNRNDVRVKKFMEDLAKEYATLNELEMLLNNDFAVGKMFTRSYADALYGVPKYNKDTNMKVKAIALLDH
jgi:hypothetical protein